jgi:succinoglycan biosynthesis transport protein ExoP
MLDELQEPFSKGEKDYWDIVRQRRWWFFLPCFVGWAVFFAVLYILPARYLSDATILVSGQSVPDKYVSSNVPSQIPQRLQAMTQQILSRTKLEKIIEEFHLYPKDRASLSPDRLVERMRSDIDILPVPIDDLAQAEDPAQAAKRALAVTPGTGKPLETLVFRLSYAITQPRLAQQVTDALVSLFIEENLAQRQRQSETTTNFLQSQVEEVRQRLQEQDARVQQFKNQYLGQLPEQKESNMQILSSLQGRLQVANDALNRAEQQKLYLESLSGEYKSLQASLNQGDTSSLQSPVTIEKELQRLRTQLTNLRGQYTEHHPDVLNLQDQIAQAEKAKREIEEQIRAAKSRAIDTDGTPHPTSWAEMQQLSPMLQVESQIKSNKSEIENAQASMKQLEKEISEYKVRLDMTPMRELELQDITRDYDQLKANFESLLGKQNDSQVATNLERRQQGQQFVVLNPASLPSRPNSPDRFIMSLIGLGVGFGLGFVVAVVTELADNRLRSHKEVKGFVTAPILANIPALLTSLEQRSVTRKLRLEWVSAILMVGLMASGTAFTFYHG